jgi:hypothetical protein
MGIEPPGEHDAFDERGGCVMGAFRRGVVHVFGVGSEGVGGYGLVVT